MTDTHGVRAAGPTDATALTDLERSAYLVALRHVFDPAVHAYPDAAVLVRWRELLARPDVVTEVVEVRHGAGLAGLVSHDRTRVRHLAVRPDRWGAGLAGLLLDRAVARIRTGGERPVLWVLADNHRARGLYAHRGWTATGRRRVGEFDPHPVEVQLALETAP